MAFRLASWVLFLLTLMHIEKDEANVIRLNTMDDEGPYGHQQDHMHQDHVHDHHPSSPYSPSSTNQKDPRLMVFFMLQDLKVGKIMPIHFPNRHLSQSQLPPKHEANNIPFSFAQLPNLLRLFSISQGSPQAIAMESTLKECEATPIKGETKFCATSLESVHEFTRNIFGSDTSENFDHNPPQESINWSFTKL